jgi:hypothetical protein
METVDAAVLTPARNALTLHSWGDVDACLPAGTTSAFVAHPDDEDPGLAAGDVLVLVPVDEDEETPSGDHGRRCAVRLVADPLVRHDPLAPGMTVLEITWGPADALTVPLPIARRTETTSAGVAALALANVVLAEHAATPAGRRRSNRPRCPTPATTARCCPPIGAAWADETSTVRAPGLVAAGAPAPGARPGAARRRRTHLDGRARPARLRASGRPRGRRARRVAAGAAALRGRGLRSPSGRRVGGRRARPGRGRGGRQRRARRAHHGAGHVDGARAGGAAGDEPARRGRGHRAGVDGGRPRARAARVSHPAARGHVAPTTRRVPPRSSRCSEPSPADAGPGRGTPRRSRSTWSPRTPDDAALAQSVQQRLESRRLAGVDVELAPPVPVPLEIVVGVCVADGYLRADVRAALLTRMSSGVCRTAGRGSSTPTSSRSGSRCTCPTWWRPSWACPASRGSTWTTRAGRRELGARFASAGWVASRAARSPPPASTPPLVRCCVPTATRRRPRTAGSTSCCEVGHDEYA